MSHSQSLPYHLQPGHPQQRSSNHDLTPHSAVSSFNLPADCDSSLITPIASTSSYMPTSIAAPNLSPLIVSPSMPQGWGSTSNLYSSSYTSDSRHRDRNEDIQLHSPNHGLPIQSSNHGFPPSPSFPPYFGNYGVSMPVPTTVTTLPGVHHTPLLESADGYPHRDNSFYRPSPAPVLIAPNPQSLKQGPVEQEYMSYGHDPLSPTESSPRSQGSDHYQQETKPLMSKKKASGKRKTDPPYETLLAMGDMTPEEQTVLRLHVKENRPWREVAEGFKERHGKKCTPASLQMKKNRLLRRLRIWDVEEEKALNLAIADFDKAMWDIKWSYITEAMRKHGSKETWSRHDVHRHWSETHFASSPEPRRNSKRRRYSVQSAGHSPWIEGSLSPTQSCQNGHTRPLAPVFTPPESITPRSRTASDASIQAQFHQQQQQMIQHHQFQQEQHQQQHQQQQQQPENPEFMFDQQQWGAGP